MDNVILITFDRGVVVSRCYVYKFPGWRERGRSVDWVAETVARDSRPDKASLLMGIRAESIISMQGQKWIEGHAYQANQLIPCATSCVLHAVLWLLC